MGNLAGTSDHTDSHIQRENKCVFFKGKRSRNSNFNKRGAKYTPLHASFYPFVSFGSILPDAIKNFRWYTDKCGIYFYFILPISISSTRPIETG